MADESRNGNDTRIARGLGWFSIALGAAEIFAPRALSRFIGVPEHRALLRVLGFREIASGMAILAQRRPSPGLWSRVAGDAMDLALLGAALKSNTATRGRIAGATAAVVGVTALDVLCSERMRRERQNVGLDSGASRVEESVTIDRSPAELYAFWRNFENLPRFMNHLKSVEVKDGNRSHWEGKGPLGVSVTWDAEIIADHPNELISWQSVPGSNIDNAGSVRFEPATGGRGTVVRVKLHYRPPAGKVGATVAKLFGENPEKQVAVDLLRFKQLMETGEIARTEGQSSGRSSSTSRRFDDFVRE